MATKRKGISPSMRWAIFSRDSFTCRYCGAQAGQEGVELHVDHVVALANGGDNRLDNLVTACQKCNGGKGQRHLSTAPTNKKVIRRIDEQAEKLRQQAAAMEAVIKAQNKMKRLAVNLKCEAYGVESVRMQDGEESRICELSRLYGCDQVLEWYRKAARYGVQEKNSLRYVHGIIRKKREGGELYAK